MYVDRNSSQAYKYWKIRQAVRMSVCFAASSRKEHSMKRKLGWLALWFGLLPMCSQVSGAGSTRLEIYYAQQPNAPLRVVSLKQTLNDAISSVEVRNYSRKAIESYQIGWIEILPNGCAATAMKPAVINGPAEEVSIAPSATAISGSYRVWVKDLVATAKSHQARLLYVQVGVMSVKFVDGSVWDYAPSEEGLFEPKDRNDLSAQCANDQKN